MSKIPVKVLNKAVIQFGDDNNYLNITLHKTLRIPDDGKVYPLPPSMGIFPVEKVDDYKDTVPKKWIQRGGIFLPMYQREAMWMQFNTYCNMGKRPKALKVAVGKVNAISGKPYKNVLDKKSQDYVVIPDQKWIDGINTGSGMIKQFVAMPLGGGYTVEEQVTGKAEFGGIQIIMYDSKNIIQQKKSPPPRRQDVYYNNNYNNYNNNNYGYKYSKPSSSYKYEKAKNYNYKPVLGGFGGGMKKMKKKKKGGGGGYGGFGGINKSYAPVMSSVMKKSARRAPARGGFGGGRGRSAPSRRKKSSNYSAPPQRMQMMDQVVMQEERQVVETKGSEMGISSGGKMKQKIIKDKYGYSNWNQAKFGRIYVHIVNSVMYKEITGKDAPKCPISASTYSSYGYPWFDFYEEVERDVKGSKILSKVKSVKEVDIKKHGYSQQDDSSVYISNVTTVSNNNIQKGEIKKIKVIEPEPVVEVTQVVETKTVEVKKDLGDEEIKTKCELLENMGFTETTLNTFMLKKHGGDVEKVIKLLIEYDSHKKK